LVGSLYSRSELVISQSSSKPEAGAAPNTLL
jgi:hypothetical protein